MPLDALAQPAQPRAYSARGVVEPTFGSPLFADCDRSARHLSRTPRTEPCPSSFCSAIKPLLAMADTGLGDSLPGAHVLCSAAPVAPRPSRAFGGRQALRQP